MKTFVVYISTLDGKTHTINLSTNDLNKQGAYFYYDTTIKHYGIKKQIKLEFASTKDNEPTSKVKVYVYNKKEDKYHILNAQVNATYTTNEDNNVEEVEATVVEN